MLEKLILFGSLSDWMRNPIYALCLTIDSFVYSLVAYSYRLFMLMTQLNYNAIYEMIYPLIDRVKALIIVFVLFKVAVFLIQCLIDPDKLDDKTAKGGKQLVINILVCAGVMGLSPFVFDLMNDLSMAMLGSYNGASYQVLPGSSSDGGFISRLVFGNTDNNTTLNSYGAYLAASTLNIFLHSKEGSNYYVADAVYNKIIADAEDTNTDFNFEAIITLVDDIGRTVVYQFPILSTVVGLFIIYSLVKISLEVGTRMFKLVVLQVIAPIPIASIISGGIGDSTFKKYYRLYLSTFTQIFIRVATLYLVTAFIGEFFTAITSGGTGLITVDASNFTKYLILIIVIISGYTFVNILPKFIGDLFGLNMGEGGKGGFGKFMTGLAGVGLGAAGAIGGLHAGFMAGISNGSGIGGTIASMGKGAFDGFAGGIKGKTIADKMKGLNAGSESANKTALNMAKMGGLGAATLASLQSAVGMPQRQAARAAMHDRKVGQLDAITKARAEALKKSEAVGRTGIKFGDSAESYAQKYAASAQIAYDTALYNGGDIAKAKKDLDDAIEAGKKEWNEASINSTSNDDGVKNAIKEYNRGIYKEKNRVSDKQSLEGFSTKHTDAAAKERGRLSSRLASRSSSDKK